MKTSTHQFAVGFVAILGFALGLGSCAPRSASEFGEFFCGAEETTSDGRDFKTETMLFGKGKSQDSTHVKTGNYACKVGPERQFGMGMKIEDAIPGSLIYASVWRYSDDETGSLVISDETGKKLYASNIRPRLRNGQWAFIEIQVRIPALAGGEQISVYVTSDHEKDAWFDDLTVTYSQDNVEVDPTYEGAPAFNLQIPEASRKQLQSYRDSAMKDGIIRDKYKKYVTALLIFDGKKVPVKMRIKGDWTDHIKSRKWSFRIKIASGETWMGMRSFNIQSPHTRNFLSEWVAHKVFEREDVLTTRYGFVNVDINDSSFGIYAYEEHFEKQLVESKNRREGPILKFDESGFWNINYLRETGHDVPQLPFYEASEILPFKKGKTMGNPVLKQQFIIARNLMFQLKTEHRPPAEILDVEGWAKYYALLDLARVAHAQNWHNKRFYYNPVTCLLEPIAFDCYSENRIASQQRGPIGVFFGNYPYKLANVEDMQNFYLFEYPEFQNAYMKSLRKITATTYIDSFYAEHREAIDIQKSWLYWDFPSIDYDDSLLYHNAASIRFRLHWIDSLIAIDALKFTYAERDEPFTVMDEPVKGISLTVYQEDSVPNAYRFTLSNFNTKPCYIVGYGKKKSTMDSLPEPFLVQAYDHSNPYRRITLDLPISPKKLYFSTEPNGPLLSAKVLDWPAPKGLSPAQELFRDNPLKSTAAYTVYDDSVKFNVGAHKIDYPICIPVGYKVVAPAGTGLDLVNGAMIISKSPVYFLGTKEAPISIGSSDQSSMGVTVLQANERSVMQHVAVRNLNTLNYKGWVLTGAVTFYESDVRIENSVFLDNLCEDGLNIVRSEFLLSSCGFANTFGDAFDADFCVGTIAHTKFLQVGNDAIDVSGSEIFVDDVTVIDAGDKGISAGENSQVTIRNTVITGGNIGVAAKDLSHVDVESLTLTGCAVGVAAYRKKPEFGAASINVLDWKVSAVRREHVIETGSSLTISGKAIAGDKAMEKYAWYGN
jgi:hypothetical protein